jgi:hypothetical protein
VSSARRGQPEGMPEFHEAQRLTLELDLDAEPIAGRVYFQEDEVVLPFSGWIGLITAIATAGTPSLRRMSGAAS